MRITNNMTTENTLRNINKAANRLATANEAEASQQKIQLASDDPVVATRAVTYRSYVSQISKYQDTATAATAWQTATDSALSDLNDVLTQVKTLATQASSTGTMTDEDRAGIKTNIETLETQAISIMNTDYSGRYIFGGYSTNEAPYKSVTTAIGDSVTYKGDYVSLGGVVSSDVSDEDIKAFYTKNAGSLYESTPTLNTVAANTKTASDAMTTAVTTYGGTTTLTDAAGLAKTASDAATLAAAAAPTDTNLAATATTAKTLSDTLAAAVTASGGTTTLTAAAATAQNMSDTLAGAVTAGGATTTLTAAIKTAQTASDTATAAAVADPTNTALAQAADTAKNLSDTLSSANKMYGGTGDQDINYNIGFDSTVTVNTQGQDVVGEGAGSNLFDTFAKLKLALDGDTTYKSASVDSKGTVTVTTNSLSISDLLTTLTTDASRLQVTQATLGARMNKVTTATNSLGDAYTAYKSLMSSNEDVDTASAISEQSSAEYCYESALSVGAKAISKTLIDYIG